MVAYYGQAPFMAMHLLYLALCEYSAIPLFLHMRSNAKVYQQPRERKIFDFFVLGQYKNFPVKTAHFHIFCVVFFQFIRRYIDRPEQSKRNKF